MTGSLQIKNNRYHMVISYVDQDGKRKHMWKSTGLQVKGNYKKAKAMLDEYLRKHARCDSDVANLQLSDYLERWMDDTEPKLSPTTIRGYREKLRNHILPYFRSKQIKLADLRVQHLESFYAYLQQKDKPLSVTSVRHCHRLLSKALHDAVRFEYILNNPAKQAELPKQSKYEAKFLNYSQVQELMTLFKDDVLLPVIQFICFYGVRRGEALGLCWDMVDFENNHFTISRTMVQSKGNPLKNSPKTDSSYRTLPLSAPMRELLLSLRARRERFTPLFPDNYRANKLVFVQDDGTPITPNYLTTHFHKIMSKSDLPTIRVHDLRHSTASNLLANGLSIVDVQHWLGHSQPSTTLNFYAHVDSTSKQNVCQSIETALNFDIVKE